MYMYVVGMVCCLVGYIFWEMVRWRNVPPGPRGLPVVGYLPWINPTEPYLSLTELARRYGPIYSFNLGSVFTVVLSDQKLMRQALAKEAFVGRADLYLTHGIMQGYGLVVAEGERWKEQRKFVASNLRNFGMVKIGPKRAHMEERIMAGVKEAIQMLSACKEPVDPKKILMHSMGNVFNSLLLGRQWQPDDPTWLWLQELAEEGVKLIGVAGTLNFLSFLRWLPRYRKVVRYLIEGLEKTHRVYERVLKEVGSGEHLGAVFAAEMARGRGGFFDTAQMNHLIADVWGAGVETTLTTLRWFFLYMAIHPHHQEKIRGELKEVVGDNEWPTLEHAQSMPYTEACLAETQRIRSVVPLGMPRGCVKESEIGGFRVPVGAMVIPLQWAIHMDPDVWPEPDTFEPARFIDDDGQFYKPEGFLPFQSGKRVCVGEEMAHMLMFLFGAGVLQKMRLSWSGTEAEARAALRGHCGITLTPGPHRILFQLHHEPTFPSPPEGRA